MNIQLLSVHHTSHGATERVVLEIVRDTNLADYLLTDSAAVNGEALAEKKYHFYFPILHVRKGDRVHVVTGSGKNMILENEAGNKTYVFFCDQSESRWSDGVTPALQLRKVKDTITITPVAPMKGTLSVTTSPLAMC